MKSPLYFCRFACCGIAAGLLPASFVLAAPAMAAPAGQGGSAAQLTLDPELYAEALREVQGGTGAAEAPVAEAPASELPPAEEQAELVGGTPGSAVSSAPGVEDWQAALRDAGTELADVRLLVLLQRLNPLDPPSARAEDYAAALRLHHLMLAGNARACLELARACRNGCFESGLLFIQSEPLALLLERRAAAFQLPRVPQLPQADGEKGLGASS